MSKRWTRLGGYLGIALVVAAGAWWGVATLMSPKVTITRVTQGRVVQAFYATGTVRPEREFPIKAASPGTLEKVLVDKGDNVKAGQPLAVLKDPALQYRADRTRAMLEEKQGRADDKTSPVLVEVDAKIAAMGEMLAISKREMDRMAAMAGQSSASSVDVDRAIDAYKVRWSENESLKAQRNAKLLELRRELQVAQAEYDAAKWDLEQQTLKSPIDGVVLDRPTSQGTRVAINDVLMRVADVSVNNLVMRAAVDEEDVTRCRDGQIVRMSLYAFAGERISGTVTRIYNEADKDRRTFEVDVKFDAPDVKLAAGMTGELAFVVAEKPVADVVPSTAYQGGAVYVVRDRRIVRSGAKVGLTSFERVEIESGLQENDAVVISPISGIAEGTRVRVTEIDPREAAGLIKEEKQKADGAAFKGFN